MTEYEIEQLLTLSQQRRRYRDPALRREIRERALITQSEIAKALGVTAPTITRWESGDRNPDDQHLASYTRLLKRLEADVGLVDEVYPVRLEP